MAVNGGETRVGPALLYKGDPDNPSNPAVSVDGTMGGIKFGARFTYKDHVLDTLGTEPCEVTQTGFGASIDAPLAQFSLTRWLYALPGEVVSGGDHIEIDGNVGQAALRSGLDDMWTIRPQDGQGDADDAEQVIFPAGFAKMESLEMQYDFDTQRVLPLHIEALPDTTNNNVRVILGLAA